MVYLIYQKHDCSSWLLKQQRWEYSERTHDGYKSEHLGRNSKKVGTTRQQRHGEWGWGRMQVNGRGYTHSIVAGVALKEPSCQFSTGTGMQVSLMVSWQRRDRGGPLSSSSWALLWTVSTTEGGGGAEGDRGQGGREPCTHIWGQEAERGRGKEDKEDTETYEARTTEHETRKQSRALSRAHCFWVATASQSYKHCYKIVNALESTSLKTVMHIIH